MGDLFSLRQLVPNGGTSGSGAIALSTGQLIAVAVFFVSSILSLLALLRLMYEARLADRDRAIAERDRRIERMEGAEEARARAADRYVDTLEAAVNVMRLQADVTTAAVEKAAQVRRQRPGGP